MSDAGDTGYEPVDILLVEDNPGDVRLTKEAFEEEQIKNTVHVVNDGTEALDFVYQREEYEDAPRPNIMLLDLNLPRKNGDEVLETVKNDPAHRDIPVIILTSSKAEEDIVQSYRLHANAYLRKPIDPEEFIEKIRSFERFWLSVVHLPDGENA